MYTVVATNTADGTDVIASTTTSNFTILNITNLLPNVRYSFRVKAVSVVLDVHSPSMFSEAVNFTTGFTRKIIIGQEI